LRLSRAGGAGAISVLKICFSFSAASGENRPASAESFFLLSEIEANPHG